MKTLTSILFAGLVLTTSAMASNCLEVIKQEVGNAQGVLDHMNDSFFSGLIKRNSREDDKAEIVIEYGGKLLDLLDPGRPKHREVSDYIEKLTMVDDKCVDAFDEEIKNLEDTVCVNFYGKTHVITQEELFTKDSERKIVHHPTPDLVSVAAYLQEKTRCGGISRINLEKMKSIYIPPVSNN